MIEFTIVLFTIEVTIVTECHNDCMMDHIIEEKGCSDTGSKTAPKAWHDNWHDNQPTNLSPDQQHITSTLTIKTGAEGYATRTELR